MKMKTIIVIFLVTIIAVMLLISGCSKKEPKAKETPKTAPKSNAPPAFPEDEKGSGGDVLPTGKVIVLPRGSQNE